MGLRICARASTHLNGGSASEPARAQGADDASTVPYVIPTIAAEERKGRASQAPSGATGSAGAGGSGPSMMNVLLLLLVMVLVAGFVAQVPCPSLVVPWPPHPP